MAAAAAAWAAVKKAEETLTVEGPTRDGGEVARPPNSAIAARTPTQWPTLPSAPRESRAEATAAAERAEARALRRPVAAVPD